MTCGGSHGISRRSELRTRCHPGLAAPRRAVVRVPPASAILRTATPRNDFNVSLMSIETWELLSYVVTVIGLPLAIFVFVYQQHKERENEDEEVYQLLSDNYQDFLKVALDHPDLQLFSSEGTRDPIPEQRERMLIIFNMLVSLFERAYLLLHDESMTPKQARRWRSWEDYMREWCTRSHFRARLPQLLKGEDPEFVTYLQRVADEEAASTL